MDKILEALSKMLPESEVKDVSKAVEDILNEAKADLEKEYKTKLEEAYGELSSELKESEKVAEQGYQEAFGIIQDLRNRLDTQNSEFDAALEEGYEEAYQMLLAERGKNENLETTLYEEYDKKLSEMKQYIVGKVDEFLQHKGKEIYEQARRDVMTDPRMVEHKVTLDKVVETVAEYISDEDYTLATSSKLETASKEIEELKGQMRILEARNIRVSTENNKLTEQVRSNATLLKESVVAVKDADKNARAEKGKNAEGRGTKVSGPVEVIAEHDADKDKETKGDSTLVESQAAAIRHQWQVLSGLKND